ncbi:MAG: ATPase [Ignisphaera sp.]|nr:ATPase [Ignisphaera sp.]MDW8085978.1 ATPase [Ignisphaera sp.]
MASLLRWSQLRVAFVSGGKDSYYAVYRFGSVDIGLMLSYEFPRPSPHLANAGKSIESMLLCGIPTLVARVSRGREFTETAAILRKLGVNSVVAGDVYIDDHLTYMERLAREVGASLVEPLWGLDPTELLYRELRDGVEPLVIGADRRIAEWVGRILSPENADSFVELARARGVDPLGEHGEYHTLVVNGPMHRARLSYRPLNTEDHNGYTILKVI